MRKIATTRLSSRGMIRMSRPAISDMMGEMWAEVMVIKLSPLRSLGKSNRELHFILLRGSTIGDAGRFNRFRRAQKMPKIAACEAELFGNDAACGELGRIACR